MPEIPSYVLCVDDDDDDLLWVREAIGAAAPALAVTLLHNGLEALGFLHEAKAVRRLPCLILLDINMPLMDGRATLQQIKADPALCDIPLVMLTTSSALAEQLFCAHYNVRLVTKPSTLKDVHATIKVLLEEYVVGTSQ